MRPRHDAHPFTAAATTLRALRAVEAAVPRTPTSTSPSRINAFSAGSLTVESAAGLANGGYSGGYSYNGNGGSIYLNGSVGATTPLNYIDLTAANIFINDGVINTIGNGSSDPNTGFYGGQTYNGNMVLGNANAALTAQTGSNGTTPNDGAITFNGAVDLGGLTLNTASDGNTTLNGALSSSIGNGSLNATVSAAGQGTLYVNAPINYVWDVTLTNLVPNTPQSQLGNYGDIRVNNYITANDNLNIIGYNRVYVGADVAAPGGNINDRGNGETFVWGKVNNIAVTGSRTYGTNPGINVSDYVNAPYTWDAINSVFTLIDPLNADVLSSDMLLFNPNIVYLNNTVTDAAGVGAISLTANNGSFYVNNPIYDSNASDFSISALGTGGDVYLGGNIYNTGGGLMSVSSQNGNVHVNAPIANAGASSLLLAASAGYGTINLNANVGSDAGSQEYNGSVVLGGDIALNSGLGAITFDGNVDGAVSGANSLTIASGGNTTFSGSVGSNAPLSYLDVTAANIALNGNVVNTIGNGNADPSTSYFGSQEYNGNVVLGNSEVL
jgi:filamentous hemagglutinin